MFSHFSSPAESTAEVGSRSVALHRFPKAVTSLAFCESTVGYAFEETMRGRFKGGEWAISTHLIKVFHKLRPILWSQSLNVVQQFLTSQQRGSLLPRPFGCQVTLRKSLDRGFFVGRVARRSGGFTRPGHCERVAGGRSEERRAPLSTSEE